MLRKKEKYLGYKAQKKPHCLIYILKVLKQKFQGNIKKQFHFIHMPKHIYIDAYLPKFS